MMEVVVIADCIYYAQTAGETAHSLHITDVGVCCVSPQDFRISAQRMVKFQVTNKQ